MPHRKYRVLDSQQLTSPSRSPSPTPNSPPQRREKYSSSLTESKYLCKRGRARSRSFTSSQEPLELPDSFITKTVSRPALEQLRFGSSELTFDKQPANDATSSGQPIEARIFSESDFPPLQRCSSTFPILVDSGLERRRVTLPETHHQQCYHRASSAPIPDPRTRSKKPTHRSTRYRDGGLDGQSSQQANLAPSEVDTSNSVGATIKSSRKDSIFTPVEAERRRIRNDMASAFPQMSGDARRHYPSGTTRYENRPPVNRATPCKNGPLCRKFQEGWTPFRLQFPMVSEAYRNQEHVHSIMTSLRLYRQQMDLACSFPDSYRSHRMLKPTP